MKNLVIDTTYAVNGYIHTVNAVLSYLLALLHVFLME
jgi:hypothetical protein